MDSKDARVPAPQRPNGTPAKRKRFRLERLEERIAPKSHYNPQSKVVGAGGGGGFDSSDQNSVGTIY
jgi:hypothetical protein